jgi:hypothetical protein
MAATMARHQDANFESRASYLGATPYREMQKQLGRGLREHYEVPKELPHRLFALLLQINRQEEDDG